MAGNNGYPGKDLVAKLQGGGAATVDPTGGYAGRAILAQVQGGGAAAPTGPTGAPSSKKSGGLLGALEHVAHVVAQKTELAGSDIKNIPGGLIDFVNKGAIQPYKDVITHGHVSAKTNAGIDKLINEQSDSVEQTLNHPGRDPFATAMLALPVLHGAGRVAERGVAVTDAARAGEGVKGVVRAATHTPEMVPRLLDVNGEQIPLHTSKSPTLRLLQRVHDAIVQHALDNKPDSRIASYGTKRLGGSLDETSRYQQRMRAAPAAALETAAKRLQSKQLPGARRVNQAALELTSVNTPPEAAAAYHLSQAEKGVEPLRNQAVAKLYQTVADRGLLTTNEHGDVIVNEADHPKLAQADKALAHVQGRGDEILARYGVRTPEALTAAADAPGRYRAGATYEKPTPGKAGVSPALIKATAERDRIGALHERALEQEQTHLSKQPASVAATAGRTGGPSLPLDNPFRERINNLGSALEVANQRVDTLTRQAEARVKPTGVIGGETARPGRGHVSYAANEPRAPSSPAAASAGPVIGEAKSPITSHANTGYNLEHGLVPADVSGQAARHFRQIVRFVNTTERRNAAIRAGSDIRQSSRDVLAKVPGEDHAQLSRTIEEAIGKRKPTVDDLNGLHAALESYKQDLVPGLADEFAADARHPVGTSAADAAAERGLAAPGGYKFVDRNLLGELARPSRARPGLIGRQLDNVNSAVTAATVYFKIGHVGTRVLTNATTNALQGSGSEGVRAAAAMARDLVAGKTITDPHEIAHTYRLYQALSDEDRARALAAAGQHGFAAMPHEGQSSVARIAAKGAGWWAKHADAPFRFNSIAYEARKAGFDTPAKFRGLLDRLERPHDFNMNAAEAAKVDWVAKRANRAQIAYDRLSTVEQHHLARVFWFYPWIKGATMFAGHTAIEHPFKSAALSLAGQEGRGNQKAELGDLPSYESGLFKVGEKGGMPEVADFSTFSPLATAADMLDLVARPGGIAGQLNPVYGSLDELINGIDQYGNKSTSPVKDALGTLFSPTPESQIVTAFLQRHQDQSRRMFPKSGRLYGTIDPAVRALLGPGAPRRINLAAAASSAARERAGR